ncbi:MAG: MCE family protein [Candidatus Omnitrophica bacterium]|nr:MCE family protein [Candidatus Omnitrophota bacterium]
MKVISFEVKVGIFILIGFILLFIMIFSIGEVYLFKPGYHVKVTFNFANGIAMNAPVRLAGIEVGEVEDIRIYYDTNEERTKVELSAWIKRDISIEEDANAVINTLGLLGEKYLEIFPGKSKRFLTSDSVLVGIDPVSTENMTMELKKLLDTLIDVAEGIKRGEGTVGRLFTDDSLYQNLEEFTADIKKNPWKLMHRSKDKIQREED